MFGSPNDGCPHCRATGEVFDELKLKLANHPIGIEQFDLSNTAQQAETSARLKELKLSKLIEGRIETAFFALLDSDGNKIQEFKPSMTSDRIASSVLQQVTR